MEERLPRELTSATPRRGKWSSEEERYTEKIIADFENGSLDVPEGTTLRGYLSKVLNCDPMRITKKYTGNSCIGKRTFTPLLRSAENITFIELSRSDLEQLRWTWVNKLLIAEESRRPTPGSKSSSRYNVGPDEGYPTTGTDEAKQMEMDKRVIAALRPYCKDPAELTYLLGWFKSSFQATQYDLTLRDLDQLINMGDRGGLHRTLLLQHDQRFAPRAPPRHAHSPSEELRRVVAAHFDSGSDCSSASTRHDEGRPDEPGVHFAVPQSGKKRVLLEATDDSFNTKRARSASEDIREEKSAAQALLDLLNM